MAHDDKSKRLEWLADKIPAYGDYAKEAAIYLREYAQQINAVPQSALAGAVDSGSRTAVSAPSHEQQKTVAESADEASLMGAGSGVEQAGAVTGTSAPSTTPQKSERWPEFIAVLRDSSNSGMTCKGLVLEAADRLERSERDLAALRHDMERGMANHNADLNA